MALVSYINSIKQILETLCVWFNFRMRCGVMLPKWHNSGIKHHFVEVKRRYWVTERKYTIPLLLFVVSPTCHCFGLLEKGRHWWWGPHLWHHGWAWLKHMFLGVEPCFTPLHHDWLQPWVRALNEDQTLHRLRSLYGNLSRSVCLCICM